MIKGITFDLEGTVVDVEMVHFEAYTMACNDVRLGLDIGFFLQEIRQFAGIGDQRIAHYLSKAKNGLDENVLLERKRLHYNELLEKVEVAPRPGFLEALAKIKEMGFRAAIGSLTYVTQAKVLLERSGLDKIFQRELIVLREDVKDPKPAPDVYLETAKRLGINPAEQLVFEDSPTGLMAAKSAGSPAIAMPVFNTSLIMNGLVEAGAVRIFSDWREMNVEAVIQNLNQGG